MTQAALAFRSPGRARPRWPLLAALAVVLVLAAGAALDRWRGSVEAPALSPAELRPGFGPATYLDALAEAERHVAGARQGLARGPDEWLRQEVLARALVARFRLAGDYADLAEADRLLDAALAGAPDPAGPVLSRAALSVLVHRLDQAEAALARWDRWAVPHLDGRVNAAVLAGDIALQRGDLRRAAERFGAAEGLAGRPVAGLRGPMLDAYRGEFDSARRGLERLLARPRQAPAALAELMLARANLAYAQGDWEDAAAWVGSANRVFPGWWLAEAYAAQQEALAGRTGAAVAAYRRLAERSGRPEVMDAFAHLLRLEGYAAASRAWAARAAQGWRERQALFPEAAAAHLADPELAVGSTARALALAKQDAARRPHGPSIALLARALILSGRPGEAIAWLDRAERQGWVSAGQLMLRAEAAAALGDEAASDKARARAEALNPRAADPRARLVWFGHD